MSIMDKICKVFDSSQSSCGNLIDHWMNLSDHRTSEFYLIRSPAPLLRILVTYFAIVLGGYQWMRSRKQFGLRKFLAVYNICMTILNTYIVYKLIGTAFKLNYSFVCEPPNVIPGDTEIINYVWLHFFSKIIELMDTVFIVIRKTDRQLTFLHVYHHSSALIFWWVALKWVPSGSPFLIAAVNSGIHIIMYLNYSLMSVRSNLSNAFWWKRYITIMQMVQFTTGIILTGNALIMGCPFPTWMMWANILWLLSFVVLFYGFYVDTYPKYKLKGN